MADSGAPVAQLSSTDNSTARSLTEGPRFLRLPEVLARVPYKRTSVYHQIRSGLFPAPRVFGPRRVCWLEKDIDAWLASRIERRIPVIEPQEVR